MLYRFKVFHRRVFRDMFQTSSAEFTEAFVVFQNAISSLTGAPTVYLNVIC